MSFFIITSFITAATSALLGIIAYLQDKKNIVNKLFCFFALTVFVWSFSYGVWLLQENFVDALFWSRMLNLGAALIPITYLHWVLVLLKENKKRTNKIILLVGYVLTFVFLSFSFSDHYINNVVQVSFFPYWPQANWLYFLYVIFGYCGMIFYGSYLIYKKIKTSTGIHKEQFRYVFIGSVIGSIGGASNFPLMLGIDSLPPVGNPFVIAYPIFFAYAILKYRLMDIRFVIKRSTIFSGMVIVIMATYALAAFLFSWIVFGDVYTFRSQVWTGLFVAVLISFGFIPLYNWLKRTTDTFLFKADYNPQEVLADISSVLSQTLDLNRVINILEEKIGGALRLSKVDVVILKDKDFLGQKNGREIKIKNVLEKTITYFKGQKEVLVLDELRRKHTDQIEFEKSFDLIEDLENLKASLVVPLKLKEKLIGLFLLGNKKSGDMFTSEDIQVLETIASQATVTIENAWLYEEMKDFSKTLQKEVNRQTKELKDANVKLKQLDEAKSEFISLASHQLRTPLSIIKGYISMILEGVWGDTSKEQKSYLKKVYSSNERLIKLVEDLLTVSRIESGRLDFDLHPLALDNLTESIVSESESIAAKKGLYLKYIKLKKSLPKIKADSLKIRQVIQNLIDNAIHYTKKGGITVSIKKENKKIIFSIQDTGIGISSKEKGILFEKFSRGEGTSKINTEGTGLGLYLAAKLIEAHKGKIWIESEGKGKGSTFHFELPV